MKKLWKKSIHRILSYALILSMVGSMMPTSVFAADEAMTHIAECSYVEAVDEIPCDMNCEDTDGDGVIDHDPDCAYTPAVEGVDCDCGAITYNSTDPMVDDDEANTTELTCIYETMCWTDEDVINSDCPACAENILNCTGEDTTEQNYELMTVEATVDYSTMFSYTTSSTDLTITKFNPTYLSGLTTDEKADIALTIPATITIGETTYDVVAIGSSAFAYSTYIESSGLTGYTITSLTFEENSNLTSIGTYAFYGLPVTGDLTLPDSITSIGYSAFEQADFDGKLTLPSNSEFTEIQKQTFEYSKFTEVEIPDNVRTIGQYAFAYMYYCDTIVIPEGVTTLGGTLFGNSNFKSITLPSTITTFTSCYVFDFITSGTWITINFDIGNVSLSGTSGSPLIYLRSSSFIAVVKEEYYADFVKNSTSSHTGVYTYETTLEFDGLDSGYDRTVLYNKPINYTKDESGTWYADTLYTLPDLASGKRWSFTDTPALVSDSILTAESNVTGSTLYAVDEESVTGDYTYYEFGSYPQTQLGFLLENDFENRDAFEAKVAEVEAEFTEQGIEFYTYDSGTEDSARQVAWFEVEPIIWRYLGASSGYYVLLSEYVLNEQAVGENTTYAGGFTSTPLYDWLNDEFTDEAFEVYEQSDFLNYVTLLNYTTYGNWSADYRKAWTSDYGNYLGASSRYWLSYTYTNSAISLYGYNYTGDSYYSATNDNVYGVRPMIYIMPDTTKYTTIGEGTFEDPYKFVEQYTYTFYDEDGSTKLKEEAVVVGTTIVAPTDPTKTATDEYAYTFDGWYDALTGGNKVTDFGEISESVSYYARYTVQYITPTATIDYVNETLTGLTASATYTITVDGTATEYTADADGKIAIYNSWFGETISIVKNGDGTSVDDSGKQELSIPARPTVSVTASDCTTLTNNDGTLKNDSTTVSIWYVSTDGGTEAEIATNGTATGLTSETYDVYIKATASTFASETVTKTIAAYNAAQETTPSATIDYTNQQITGLVSEASYTITVNGSEATCTTDTDGNITIDNSWYNETISIVKNGDGTYTKDSDAQELVLVSEVVNSLEEGSYTDAQELILSHATNNATIYYTIDYGDGADDTQEYDPTSNYYISKNCTITAWAELDGAKSAEASWIYTVSNAISLDLTKINDTSEIITGNTDATEDTFDIILVSGITDDEQSELSAEMPSGYEFAEGFHLYATVNGEIIFDADFNGTVGVTLTNTLSSSKTYQLLHLKNNDSIETFTESDDSLVVDTNDNSISFEFDVSELSPFMLVSKVVSSSGSGSSSSSTYYDITIGQSGSGTISPDGGSDSEYSIKKYSSQTFTFTPSSGYQVSDVLIDGISIGAVSSYTFSSVTGDHTLFVVFSETDAHINPQTGVTLNRDDHDGYMSGYPDGSFGPNQNITRAETIVMFSRLLTEAMDDDTTYTSTFWDVSEDDWFANAVGYMEQFGIISGYEDGSFGGNQPITRAEFATIASRFDELASSEGNIFSDVPESHWASAYINSAAEKGWISGYEDGTFKPDQYITRAEAVTLVNNVLDRSCDMDFVETYLDEIKQFTDVDNTHWAYYQIMEATNSHDYEKDADGNETWAKLN